MSSEYRYTTQLDDEMRLDINAMALNIVFNLKISPALKQAIAVPAFIGRLNRLDQYHSPDERAAFNCVLRNIGRASQLEPEDRLRTRRVLLAPEHLSAMTCMKATNILMSAFHTVMGLEHAQEVIPANSIDDELRDALYDAGAPALGLACDIRAHNMH